MFKTLIFQGVQYEAAQIFILSQVCRVKAHAPAQPAPYINGDKKEVNAVRQHTAGQRLRGFRQAQHVGNGNVPGTNGNRQTYFRVVAGKRGGRKGNTGGLPGRFRLNVFHYAMPVNHKWLKRTQLAIDDARMLKLVKVAAYPWHAGQCAAHDSWALPAANHNSITVVVQLTNRAFFEFRKECHGDMALILQSAALASLSHVLGSE